MNFLKIILLILIISLFSCSNEQSKVPANVVNIPNSASGNDNSDGLPVIEFATIEHDFGKVIQGEVVSYSFKFKNTGKSDLVIANISAACGCTASEYPRTPVRPGEEQSIVVTFNSAGKTGFQNKTLEVAANTQPSNTILTIKAMVFIPEKD
jgi:Tfp pilus tip-associated adhesin PilY1